VRPDLLAIIKRLKPTRVALPSFGSTCARFETWIGISLEMMPPSWPADLTLVAAGHVDAGDDSAVFLRHNGDMTSPDLPLSLPVRTTTRSPFLILSFAAITAPPVQAK
jgi:hypothetical protein